MRQTEAFSSHFSFFLVFFCFARSVLRERAQGGREGEFLRRAFGVQKRESVEEREGVQKREKIFFNFSHSPRATRPLCEIEAAIFLCRQNYKTERCWGAGGGGGSRPKQKGECRKAAAEKKIIFTESSVAPRRTRAPARASRKGSASLRRTPPGRGRRPRRQRPG